MWYPKMSMNVVGVTQQERSWTDKATGQTREYKTFVISGIVEGSIVLANVPDRPGLRESLQGLKQGDILNATISSFNEDKGVLRVAVNTVEDWID